MTFPTRWLRITPDGSASSDNEERLLSESLGISGGVALRPEAAWISQFDNRQKSFIGPSGACPANGAPEARPDRRRIDPALDRRVHAVQLQPGPRLPVHVQSPPREV